jgi:N-acetylglucosamine-6-phosphate deacetylase
MINSIRAGRIWTPEGWLTEHVLIIQDGRIQAVQPLSEFEDLPPALDARHDTIIPGLIDLQVNGALGHSFQASDHDHFEAILKYHLQAGTTTLLPTIITAPEDTLIASLNWLADHLQPDLPITLPGIHLEGPFLAPEKSGAHDPTALLEPDRELTRAFYDAAKGQLRLLTLAPELPGAQAVIRYLAAKRCHRGCRSQRRALRRHGSSGSCWFIVHHPYRQCFGLAASRNGRAGFHDQ